MFIIFDDFGYFSFLVGIKTKIIFKIITVNANDFNNFPNIFCLNDILVDLKCKTI